MEEITGILVDLFILFAAAKIAGELFARARQPALVGEVLVGVLIGPHAVGLGGMPDSSLIDLFEGKGDEEAAKEALTVVLDVLALLGVIILLFFVGLETRLRDLLDVGGRATLVAVLGIIFPFVLGFALIWAIDPTGAEDLEIEAAFVATAMVATSVGITARVLGDIGAIRTRESRIILGAAVVDDILALLMLAVVSGLGGDDFDALELGLTALAAVAFVVFAALVGTRVIQQYSIHLEKLKIRNAPFLVAMIVMLGLSALAGIIGLAAIIGAFLAGMILAEAKERFNLEQQALPVYEFLVPFFFVIIGTKVDPGAFTDTTILAIALGVTALAVLGKLIGGGIASAGLPVRSAAIVGTGMVPRGEVGLVVASIGAGIGAISDDIFSVVVFMSIATTILAPPVLVWLYRGYRFEAEEAAGAEEEAGLPEL
ncbi:MAG: cation:proton antiporter [Dehalococcoidia bacterium]|nr:MAG: cation:proton antiporter [Dehalococcoidia bacterium]